MATLAQYREWVFRYLHELENLTAGSDLYSATNVDAALNAGQSAWVLRLDHDFFKKQTTVDINLVSADMGGITAGVRQDLPSDYLAHLQVFYRPTGAVKLLKPISAERLDAMTQGQWRNDYLNGTTGEPEYYMVQAAYSESPTVDTVPWMMFWPAPATPQTNALGLRYTRKPNAMTQASDTSKVMAMFPQLDMLALPAFAMKTLLNFERGTADDQIQKWDAIWEQCVAEGRSTLKQLVRNY